MRLYSKNTANNKKEDYLNLAHTNWRNKWDLECGIIQKIPKIKCECEALSSGGPLDKCF